MQAAIERNEILEEKFHDSSEVWHRIVEQYSALKLTIENDRLPALSSLAVRSYSNLGSYLAGLWDSTLRSDLMWRVNLLETNVWWDKTYIAPSWSWASIHEPVSYWTAAENKLPESQVGSSVWCISRQLQEKVYRSSLQGLVEITGTNPYGSVRSGTLTVDGHLVPAWVKSNAVHANPPPRQDFVIDIEP